MDRTMTDKTVGTQLKWLWLAVLVLAIDLGTKALASTLAGALGRVLAWTRMLVWTRLLVWTRIRIGPGSC